MLDVDLGVANGSEFIRLARDAGHQTRIFIVTAGMSDADTDRERDVLNGVLDGLSNKEIAGALGISEGSVKSALQQLFLKAGVRTRSRLVRVAMEEYSTAWRLR